MDELKSNRLRWILRTLLVWTIEVIQFEELNGFHGGLGGNQSKPFLMFPADWELVCEEIIGAGRLYS